MSQMIDLKSIIGAQVKCLEKSGIQMDENFKCLGNSQCLEQIIRITANGMKSRLDFSKKTVAVWHDWPVFSEHFKPMLPFLKGKCNIIILVPPQMLEEDAGLDGVEVPYFYTHESILKHLDFIDLFVGSFADRDFPPDRPRMVFHHFNWFSDYDWKGELFEFAGSMVDTYSRTYDFITLTCLPDCLKNRKNRKSDDYLEKIPRSFLKHGNKSVYLIPAGYPKLDVLIDHVVTNRKKCDRIIICPAMSIREHYMTKDHGENIVRAVLENFPEHKIVFRPIYPDRNNEEVVRLAESFKDNPRFIFDLSPSYLEHYANGAIMITDTSGTALTFTLGTLKSSLYFIFGDQSARGLGAPVALGHKAENIGQLIESMKTLMDNPEEQNRIREIRERSFCHVGKSAEKYAETIISILKKEKPDDWIEFRLFGNEAPSKTEEDSFKNLDFLVKTNMFLTARHMAMEMTGNYPQNAFVWLIHYHMVNSGLKRGEPSAAEDALAEASRLFKEMLRDEKGFGKISNELMYLGGQCPNLMRWLAERALFPPILQTRLEVSALRRQIVLTDAMIIKFLEEYVKQKWKEMHYTGISKVALFGCGAHTEWLEPLVSGFNHPEIVAVLDDNPPEGKISWGKKAVSAAGFDIYGCNAIVLSTDCHQKKMFQRCKEIFGENIKIIDLYEDLPAGPYPKNQE